jgi:hypothetical protein
MRNAETITKEGSTMKAVVDAAYKRLKGRTFRSEDAARDEVERECVKISGSFDAKANKRALSDAAERLYWF